MLFNYLLLFVMNVEVLYCEQIQLKTVDPLITPIYNNLAQKTRQTNLNANMSFFDDLKIVHIFIFAIYIIITYSQTIFKYYNITNIKTQYSNQIIN